MMEILTMDQGSAAWHEARRGIPTASEFAAVMATGKGGKPSASRRTYMLKLAGEIITGEMQEQFVTAHMVRGHTMEPEARDLYAFVEDQPIQQVGFIRNWGAGCSPDGLVGDAGLLEIKTNLPHIHIERMLADEYPPEHVAQAMGCLWIAEREWIDMICYWPKMPRFVKRLYRDEEYIGRLADAVSAFNEELAAIVDRIREIGGGK